MITFGVIAMYKFLAPGGIAKGNCVELLLQILH